MAGDAAFGVLLRRYRRRAALSQEELAARSFVSARTISDLERGVNARPRLHTAVALAEGLGLDRDEREGFERHARPLEVAHERSPVGPGATPPVTLDSFIDDGSSLDSLVALVGDRRHRLVTLVGPGGVGKTRLALEMARRLDGPIAFVSLASLDDPDLLAGVVGDALGVDHGPSRTYLESLVQHFGSQPTTLVLDNMEQIADAADLPNLLHECLSLTVVATSRVPLQIGGEVRFEVKPLDAARGDPADRPSVRLFLERAAATGYPRGQRPDEVAVISELCGRLDGLPLAIELAAARARVIAPNEMLRNVDRLLDLLRTGRTDVDDHHRSLSAAFEWSFQLLEPAERAAFAALGALANAAGQDAVMSAWGMPEASLATFFDRVQALADAHLVSVEHSASVDALRIDMLQTTRQFARRKLDQSGETDRVYRNLTDWALALIERAERALNGPDQSDWLDRLDGEIPNLRVIGHWLAEQGTDEAADDGRRIAYGLQRFWDIRARWEEGAAWLREALDQPGGSESTRGQARKSLGVMYRCLGRLDDAESELERARAMFASLADELGEASCLNNLGAAALDRADFERAAELFGCALGMCEDQGDEWLTSIVLNNLGLATAELGELRDALRTLRRSGALLAAHGNLFTLCWADDNLGAVLTLAGHPQWAVPIHRRTIRVRLELGDENGFTWSLEALAAAWTAIGDLERAGHALGHVAAQRRRLGMIPVPYLVAVTDRRIEELAARVGRDRAEELWNEGARLDPAVVRSWFEVGSDSVIDM